jgi:hypothetical protein
MTTTIGRSVISRKVGQRARTIGVAKAHGIKDAIQSSLPRQEMSPAFVLLIAIKPNNPFGFVFYVVHKAKVSQKSI